MTGAGGAYLRRSLNEPFAPRLSRFSESDRKAAIAGAIEELNIDAHRLPSIFKVAEASWIQSLAIPKRKLHQH